MRCFAALLIGVLLGSGVAAADRHMPYVEGPWIPLAGNPDLGELAGERQQPVDFCLWQAADGTWQLWSCIRNTKSGGRTRLFHRWEGQRLTDPNWRPLGVAMQADPALGETVGGLQAPHVVRVGDTWHMFYGDWEHICHATSRDGKTFERVRQPSGKTGLFTEGLGSNTRDIMMLKIGGLWHGYYTAYPHRQGAVYLRTTQDFATWSEPTCVAFAGAAGTGMFSSECPHVVERQGTYYLFRTQAYGQEGMTAVYHSADPRQFGTNQDRQYFLTALPIAAPEIVTQDGQDYVAVVNPGYDGISLAKLAWERRSAAGEAVLNLDDEAVRRQWKRTAGDLTEIFTQSTRADFLPPQQFFIGTGEPGNQRDADEMRTATIVSPPFVLSEDRYLALVSGGTNQRQMFVALVDAESDRELLRIGSSHNDDTLRPVLIRTDGFRGKRAYVKIVDESKGLWGHINFGGLFVARAP